MECFLTEPIPEICPFVHSSREVNFLVSPWRKVMTQHNSFKLWRHATLRRTSRDFMVSRDVTTWHSNVTTRDVPWCQVTWSYFPTKFSGVNDFIVSSWFHITIWRHVTWRHVTYIFLLNIGELIYLVSSRSLHEMIVQRLPNKFQWSHFKYSIPCITEHEDKGRLQSLYLLSPSSNFPATKRPIQRMRATSFFLQK